MKKFTLPFILILLLVTSFQLKSSIGISDYRATKNKKAEKKKLTTFLVKMYDARMIEELAHKRGVSLPSGLSAKKAKGLEDLKKEEGQKFDKKFIKMIKKDHQQDIRKSKKAVDIKDKQVSTFARQNLPLIEDHLRKLNEIK